MVKDLNLTKTGTTIVGAIYKDGVILGADTRATAGAIVADKNCKKIEYIAPNIYCCGAGTAADAEYIKGLLIIIFFPKIKIIIFKNFIIIEYIF